MSTSASAGVSKQGQQQWPGRMRCLPMPVLRIGALLVARVQWSAFVHSAGICTVL